jgi:hypothetical protein
LSTPFRAVLGGHQDVIARTADPVRHAGTSRVPIDSGQPTRAMVSINVGQARAEAIAEQPEQAEHHVAVGTGIGHDLRRLEVRLLFEHYGQQDQAVAQRARHGDVVRMATW